ncbi:hypothetical protein J2W51_002353 [Tardiphaga robiniae]|uniref:hypothetical protein n=1 Tax=Tardiphaga robiniae TaxID=943830 RepID=UPI00286334B8|nr:hypothetical protein [Tardiphaga robiniae]MDR6659783.1 hypothetical protein [Tardiphaga robiniae]
MNSPTRKRQRAGAGAVSEAAWAFLNDALTDDIGASWERWGLEADQALFLKGPPPAELWSQFRDVVLKRWILERPGSRPSLWWRYDAPRLPRGTYEECFWDGMLPEPRLRVGGVGTALQDVLAYVPVSYLGVPKYWQDHEEASISPEIVPINPENPPTFESQASYLDRFGLMTASERRRVDSARFSPESVIDILAGARRLSNDSQANG